MKNMKSLILGIATISSVGLLLGACSNSSPTSSSDPRNSSAPSPVEVAPAAGSNTDKGEESQGKGGQVVESGKYHLELVPEKEANSTHLDLYVQKGDTHAAVADAKVTAEVQLPGGKQESMPLSYDAAGKHYTAALPGKAPGQYQVKITAVIGGDQADGRFSFSR
jgi:hypothetical protein